MSSAQRSLIALFAATFAQLTGFFLFGPWLLFTLKDQGLGTAAVGAFGSLQWAGLLVATPFASSWAQRLGPRLALLVSGLIPLFALAAMVMTTSRTLWALLYFVAVLILPPPLAFHILAPLLLGCVLAAGLPHGGAPVHSPAFVLH